MKFISPFKKNLTILALGAESSGNFSVLKNNEIFLSEGFGNLLEEKNFQKYKKSISEYLKQQKVKPDIVLTDLHPLYVTTELGQEMAKKTKAKHIKIQHHLAHIFSAIGEELICEKEVTIYTKTKTFFGISCDGTGYGLDEKIWGGEVFEFSQKKGKISDIKRIGHLENQTLIGGDLAIKEPARMIISILNKFLKKEEIYNYTKKHYTKNEFELLYNQLQQKFNCQEASSTGRVLDAVSVLLDFAPNKRNYKHEATELLEQNSTRPYIIKPKLEKIEDCLVLQTTPLFKYIVNNIDKDKKRLAATAQLYIAKGLYEIAKTKQDNPKIYLGGGITKNKIILKFLETKNTKTNKFFHNKKIPCGDASLSFGQIVYYLMN